MPWQAVDEVGLRRELVTLAGFEGANRSELCRRFGVSRKTGYKWLQRHLAAGVEGLADRSRRPHRSPARTAAAIEAVVVGLRQAHPAWGGRKIRKRWLRPIGSGCLRLAPVP